MSSLTKSQIRDAFELFDRRGSGALDATELTYAMKALGFADTSKAQAESIIRTHDRIGANTINFHDFERLMMQKAPRWDSDDEMRMIFNLFAKKGDGFIHLEDLRETARYLGEDVDEQTLNRMIREADVLDQDGKVNYHEFKKIFLGYGRKSTLETTSAAYDEY